MTVGKLHSIISAYLKKIQRFKQ